MIPSFEQAIPDDGYAWWYIDAISDDGRHGLTVIGFLGSVFSPYYFWERRLQPTDPLNHCALNIALYGPGARWAMTERGRTDLQRSPDRLAIGPSAMCWTGEALKIEIREWTAPLPRRVRGRLRVHPVITNGEPIALDPAGDHHWTPIWPAARIEVDLDIPRLRWSGNAYVDHNAGRQPLERCFEDWFWSRSVSAGGTVVLYELELRDRQRQTLALHFDRCGTRRAIESTRSGRLPPTRWRLERPLRSDDGAARLLATWEDTPFYARSLFAARLNGERVTAVHESLSLRRFENHWIQFMLPFRMPRRERS